MDLAPFFRHVARCNDLPSLEGFLPFHVGGRPVGWIAPETAAALVPAREVVREGMTLALAPSARTPAERTEALAALADRLVARGLIPRLRGELYDVRAEPNGESLARIDRAAIPAFGIAAEGVHANGLVRRAEGLFVWIGVRARDKTIAPGKRDTLIGGGIAAGETAFSTLLKEAEEEASLPASLAATARAAGRVRYRMAWREPGQARGMRRDTLHLFDLDLAPDVVPRPNDGEVERFDLLPIAEVVRLVRETDDFKFNIPLVLIDLFLRLGLIPAGEGGARLRAALDGCPTGRSLAPG
ncbi:MAG: DUF4743 domain-containing protein [Elioraea sp.]|nr:DUF4743 domain-containing protein [Elioraea sp.]